MQFFTVVATLTAFTDDGWWLPPPPVATGTPCPGGAEFRYVQKWPSGFKAVVQFKGEWVPGRVVVGLRDALGRKGLSVTEVNWLGDGPLKAKVHRVQVKIRSMFKPVPAVLFGTGDDRAQVKFDEPQNGVAPGQACVFYQDDRVLGGGWIARDDAG